MNLRTWLNPQQRELSRAQKRAAKTSTSDLQDWADLASYSISRLLSDYRRHPDSPAILDEALIGAEAITAAIEELRRRATLR